MNKVLKCFSYYTGIAMLLISYLSIASLAQNIKSEENTLPSKNSPVLQPSRGAKGINLTDEDRVEIVNQALQQGLVKKEIVDHERLASPIVLSTKNIKNEYVPKLDGYKLELLSPEKIEKKAEKEGAFLYLSFHIFKVEGEKVEVLLLNKWAGKPDEMSLALVGGGIYYEFRKDSGKWTSRMSGMVVP